VRAVEHTDAWLALVDPKVAELAGLGDVHLIAVEALEWVNLLAPVYVKPQPRRGQTDVGNGARQPTGQSLYDGIGARKCTWLTY
jgi:hypothetical protein